MPPADGRSTPVVEPRREGESLTLVITGSWTTRPDLPRPEAALFQGVRHVSYETSGLEGWGSGLVLYVADVRRAALKRQLEFNESALPDGVLRLVDLATAVPDNHQTREFQSLSVLATIGSRSLDQAASFKDAMAFTGELVLGIGRLFRGKAGFRFRDFMLQVETHGPNALPIVALINFLVGMILAFVGAIQLKQFGAEIYVANLVGIAVTREMASMMTAIIMTGRTGAAYAAELGTMTVNEEIDALRTTGVSPFDFLVLPRVLALTLVMPLLALFADFVGILGGMFVSFAMLGISFEQYFAQTVLGLSPMSFYLGLIKACVYGVLVAGAGCLQGMQSGRSASAVGLAVTSAVVTGIILVIVASALLTVVYTVLGF